MKWYGSSLTTKPHLPNRTKKLKRFLTPASLPSSKTSQPLSLYQKTIQLPSTNVLIVQNTNMSLICLTFAPPYRIIFPLPTPQLAYIDTTLSKFVNSQLYRSPSIPHFFSNLVTALLSIHSFFIVKLKFKGKGYNIFRNYRNTILFKFGYSHRIYGFFNTVSLLNFSKTSLLMYSFSRQILQLKGQSFFLVKPINLYTGRGIRFARQIIYRKLGKVGSYR